MVRLNKRKNKTSRDDESQLAFQSVVIACKAQSYRSLVTEGAGTNFDVLLDECGTEGSVR